MSFTAEQIERLTDRLKSVGFEIPSEWDVEDIARLAACVIEALEIDFAA